MENKKIYPTKGIAWHILTTIYKIPILLSVSLKYRERKKLTIWSLKYYQVNNSVIKKIKIYNVVLKKFK